MYSRKKPVCRLPSLKNRLCKNKMIVIISLFLMLILTSCAEQNIAVSDVKNIITCRQEVVTYGDALECLIRLDEAQYARQASMAVMRRNRFVRMRIRCRTEIMRRTRAHRRSWFKRTRRNICRIRLRQRRRSIVNRFFNIYNGSGRLFCNINSLRLRCLINGCCGRLNISCGLGINNG